MLYDDGHMLEFAVFDLDEIAAPQASTATACCSTHGGVEERIAHVAANPRPPRDDQFLFGKTVAAGLVAYGRGRRGETLSAAFMLTWATTVPEPPADQNAPQPERVAPRRLRLTPPLRARLSGARRRARRDRPTRSARGRHRAAGCARARAAAAAARPTVAGARWSPRPVFRPPTSALRLARRRCRKLRCSSTSTASGSTHSCSARGGGRSSPSAGGPEAGKFGRSRSRS